MEVDLVPCTGVPANVEYEGFLVGDALSSYKLSVQSSSGTISVLHINNTMFSTYDEDNDEDIIANRAEEGQGGGGILKIFFRIIVETW